MRTGGLLIGILFHVGTTVFAVTTSSIAGAAPAMDQPNDSGFEMSINSGTQLNTSALSIGCGYVGGGRYYDEDAKADRAGPHADLTIVVLGKVPGKPALFRQVSMGEGGMIDIGAHRILVVKVFPLSPRGPTEPPGAGKSSVIVRIWRRAPGSQAPSALD